MNIFLFVLPWAALGIALAVVAAGAAMGKNVFKKQGVAWVLTIVMVCVSIGIGYAKAPMAGTPEPRPETPNAPAAGQSYVWDDANALSSRTERELDERNERLWNTYRVTIGVVTCDNERDLGEYAMGCAEKMGLGGYDMIVALDIAGENYWFLLGGDVDRDFPYDPSEYACDYMERPFAKGDYDNAVLSLTDALERWYGDYFD